MIHKIIDEINVALNNELYLVALSSALTLPDVCGKAEYSKDKNGVRYKNWYNKFVTDKNLPAEYVYKLRCSLLHEGNSEVHDHSVVHFKLMTNSYSNLLGIDFCFNSKITHADGTSESTVTVYVGYLCTALCRAATDYYNKNKDKFDFINYSIQDMSQIMGVLGR